MRSYNSTTNLSIDVVWLVIPSNLGCKDVLENEVVSLPKWLHVFYATFFPLHAKNETWSHQLNAWKSGRYFDFLGPRAAVILCISRHLICFPVSIGNQISSKSSCSNKPSDIATASVSSVQISIYFIPDWLVSFACNNILVSASSWFEVRKNSASSASYSLSLSKEV